MAFFDYFEASLQAGNKFLTNRDDHDIALERIRAETPPPVQTVISAPVESAPVSATSKNTLLYGGIGLGVVLLLTVAFVLVKR